MSGYDFYAFHVPLRPEDTVLAPELQADFASGRTSVSIDARTGLPVPGAQPIVTTMEMVENFTKKIEEKGARVARRRAARKH